MNGDFVELVREHLEPTLLQYGFAAGQGGLGDDSGMVIFCQGSDDFFARFAGTDFYGEQINDGGCMDVLVYAALTDRWHASGIALNGVHFATPELPRESLVEEVTYIAERFLPMLTGAAPVEWAPMGWRALQPTHAPEFVARSEALPSAALRRAEWDSVGMFTTVRDGRPHAGAGRGAPWGGAGAPLWKRLAAAIVRAGGINIGRFPK